MAAHRNGLEAPRRRGKSATTREVGAVGRSATPSPCRVVVGGGGAPRTYCAFATGQGSGAPLLHRRRFCSVTAATCLSLTSASSSLADDSFCLTGDQASQQTQQRKRMARADEPNLFEIPPDLHPTYRSVPTLLRAGIAVASALVVGRSALSRLLSSSPFSFRSLLHFRPSRKLVSPSFIRGALSFLLRTALLSTIANLAVQEAAYPPSRVTTGALAERGELPSSLSQYAVVQPLAVCSPVIETGAGDTVSRVMTSSWSEGNATKPKPIGVHSIRYAKLKQDAAATNWTGRKYDKIYLHHGFGASSLSWLPVLPPLVERLGNPRGQSLGLAHDAPGFGFTDRPDGDADGGLEQYGSANNAGIALALLEEESETDGEGDAVKSDRGAKSVAIFGHSMGSKAALLMALQCASQPRLRLTPNLVVLVAPALDGVTLPSSSRGRGPSRSAGGERPKGWIGRVAHRAWIAWRKAFLDYPLRYGLRRLVNGSGGGDFWRRGLSLVWGDPARLSDSDALRFRWPSVGEGWEQGLINFARSMLLSLPKTSDGVELDDRLLLKEVANLEDTRVVIIFGSKDGVVRIEGPVAKKLRGEYPGVKLARIEGMGHDPFEEDVDGFLTELEKALED